MRRTIGTAQLAEILNYSPHTIHSALQRRPHLFPPECTPLGAGKRLWFEDVVYAWLEGHQRQPLIKRRRGRPTKVEQRMREQLGTS